MIHPTQQINKHISLDYTAPSGEAFQVTLDADRAAYLPLTQTLLVSDLHWGKSETFQRHGIPIPDSLLLADLSRLSQLIDTYQPQRLLILGDLIHGKMGLTDELDRKILAWRSENGLPIVLVAGNHDSSIQPVADLWGINVITEDLKEGPFLFSHEPVSDRNLFNWCGHIHPSIRLRTFHDTLRLPCFHVQPHGATLPAFSEFTGGYNIQAKPGDRVFALSDGVLIPVQ